MERNLPRNRSISLRKKAIIGTVLVASISSGSSLGHDIMPEIPYSPGIFTPIKIREDSKTNTGSMVYSNFKIEPVPSPVSTEKALTPQEQKIQELQNKTADYVKIVQESGKFSSKWINDLEMYGPIYIAVAEKFGIDWKMLWITHELESGASAKDSKAFDGSTYPYVGGMQRNQKTWTDEFVKEAFISLEYLNTISTNHIGDAQEIAGAGAIMAPNIKQYRGLGEERAIFNTFSLYSGSKDSAQKRLDIWIMTDNVFSFFDRKISPNFIPKKAV